MNRPTLARALELLPALAFTTAAAALVLALAQTHTAITPAGPARAPISSITPTGPMER